YYAVFDKRPGVLPGQLVLRRRGHGDFARDVPHRTALDIANRTTLKVGVLGDAASPDLLDLLQEVKIHTVRLHDIAAGVRAGDAHAADRLHLFDGVDRHVAGAGDRRLAAGQVDAAGGEHSLHEIDRPVAGRLAPRAGAAVDQALARQDACLV